MLSRVFKNRYNTFQKRKLCIPNKPKLDFPIKANIKLIEINNIINYGQSKTDKENIHKFDIELQRFFEYRDNGGDLLDPSDFSDFSDLTFLYSLKNDKKKE